MEKTNRWPSGAMFFHWAGFPGNGPGILNRSFGVPAWNVGPAVISTDMTSQSRVMKNISFMSCRQKTMPIAPFLDTCTAGPAGASGLFGSKGRT